MDRLPSKPSQHDPSQAVKLVELNSHVCGLYQDVLCLYELCQTGKIALLGPEEKLRPSFLC